MGHPAVKKNTSRYKIRQIWENHHEIARRLVAGEKAIDIANDMGYSPNVISYTRHSPIVKEKIAELNPLRDAETAELARHIAELAPA